MSPAPTHNIMGREYFIGLDLGQRRDRTAIAVLERLRLATIRRNPVTFQPESITRRAVRHLECVSIGTPYTVVVERVTRIARQLASRDPATIVVDATGVGLPVADTLRMPAAAAPTPWRLMPVVIGHTHRDTYSDGFWRVSKRDLIARLQLAFDACDIAIAGGLREAEILVQELTAMRATVRPSGRTRYESPGDAHDDLAIAVALAWWGAEIGSPATLGVNKPLL